MHRDKFFSSIAPKLFKVLMGQTAWIITASMFFKLVAKGKHEVVQVFDLPDGVNDVFLGHGPTITQVSDGEMVYTNLLPMAPCC